MAIALAAGFGLIIGSFLNVFVLRRSMRALSGRSECLSCGRRIKWYDMIPVLSWMLLRGRCRSCGSSISAQYPLVEATTAIAFAVIAASGVFDAQPLLGTIYLFIAALLIAIAAYDILHTIIPDGWAYSFALGALASMFVVGISVGASIPIYLLAGPIAALPLFLLWLISGGRWIGLGDAKLALGIGWLLGPYYGIVAVFFAFVVGAIISVGVLMPMPIVLRFLHKQGIARFHAGGTALTMKSEVPFGPFLIASCAIIWFSLLFNIPMPL
jgi:leader peptidase (prepilin peptidase)/N-methyltransferase